MFHLLGDVTCEQNNLGFPFQDACISSNPSPDIRQVECRAKRRDKRNAVVRKMQVLYPIQY